LDGWGLHGRKDGLITMETRRAEARCIPRLDQFVGTLESDQGPAVDRGRD
jgi:hypothetical protein